MAQYRPNPRLQGLGAGEQSSALTAESVMEFLRLELERIADAMHNPDFLQLTQLSREPTKLYTGLTVMADGTNWDPGAGQGVYTYYAGTWNKLG